MTRLFQGVRNLLLAALLLVCVLCVTEVGLRAARWYQAHARTGSEGETDESEVVIAGGETFFQLRPLALVERNVPESGGTVEVRTNSIGLRGPEIELPKPAGVFRILCLGDETTLAPEVAEEQTYCHQLQELLQPLTDLKVEVINAGQPGGCPLTCELLLRRRLLGVQPDLILLHCDDSDVSDDRLARRFTRVDANGVPLAAVHPLATTDSIAPAAQLYDEFVVLDLLRNRLVGVIDSRSPENPLLRTTLSRSPVAESGDAVSEVDIEQTLGRLPQMRDLASGIYCEFIVSTCPTTFDSGFSGPEADSGSRRMHSVSLVAESSASLSRRLAEVAREHGITFVDGAVDFAPGEEQLFLRSGSNLSPDGHARYARALARTVYERVPGVWTRQPPPRESPGVPPLPGVARSPRDGSGS